jgi:hypothetical protein
LDDLVVIDERVAFEAFDISCQMTQRLPLTDALIAAERTRPEITEVQAFLGPVQADWRGRGPIRSAAQSLYNGIRKEKIMRKSSLLKFGFAVLIAISTMLAARSVQADLCVYRYTLPNGEVCTFVRYEGTCCIYRDGTSTVVCPPICGVG